MECPLPQSGRVNNAKLIHRRAFSDPEPAFTARLSVRLQRIPRPVADHRSGPAARTRAVRSEEHTSELQSLMRISYAVFCLKKKKTQYRKSNIHKTQSTMK